MAKKYIPEHVITSCAREAYHKTQEHYNGTLNTAVYHLLDQPDSVVRRVLKDTRAVLLGNRTAADLHTAWALRKFEACGNSWQKVEERFPTAVEDFHNLTQEDQNGYSIFVNTVRDTYKALSQKNRCASDIVKVTVEASRLHALVKEQVGGSLEYNDSDGTSRVSVFFDCPQLAREFWELVSKV